MRPSEPATNSARAAIDRAPNFTSDKARIRRAARGVEPFAARGDGRHGDARAMIRVDGALAGVHHPPRRA